MCMPSCTAPVSRQSAQRNVQLTTQAQPTKTQNRSRSTRNVRDRPRSHAHRPFTPSGSSTGRPAHSSTSSNAILSRRQDNMLAAAGEEPVVAAPAPSPLHLRPQCNSRGGDGSARAGAAGGRSPAPLFLRLGTL
jgi:hypothetical protein